MLTALLPLSLSLRHFAFERGCGGLWGRCVQLCVRELFCMWYVCLRLCVLVCMHIGGMKVCLWACVWPCLLVSFRLCVHMFACVSQSGCLLLLSFQLFHVWKVCIQQIQMQISSLIFSRHNFETNYLFAKDERKNLATNKKKQSLSSET